jgi:hypothetical protein
MHTGNCKRHKERKENGKEGKDVITRASPAAVVSNGAEQTAA